MLTLTQQLAKRSLVCPQSHVPLIAIGDRLQTLDGRTSYPVSGGVPILLAEPSLCAAELARANNAMVREYTAPPKAGWLRAVYRSVESLVGDRRTDRSEQAFSGPLEALPPDALSLSIGGGPIRIHRQLVNVNIGLFQNVDVVADAYSLPYARDSVALTHCEAVLEHLEFPDRAVSEMYRVLKPGSCALAATPFLQPYHAYPDHYQNFTHVGHSRLFERAGFIVEQSGTCVGPSFALRDLVIAYIRHVLPGGRAGPFLSRLAALLLLPTLFFDDLVATRKEAVFLASTTFVVARKPL